MFKASRVNAHSNDESVLKIYMCRLAYNLLSIPPRGKRLFAVVIGETKRRASGTWLPWQQARSLESQGPSNTAPFHSNKYLTTPNTLFSHQPLTVIPFSSSSHLSLSLFSPEPQSQEV